MRTIEHYICYALLLTAIFIVSFYDEAKDRLTTIWNRAKMWGDNYEKREKKP